MIMERADRIPRHVTIIMDGNGRWAKQRKEERLFGHEEGKESVRACVEYALERGIKYLSLFAFSEENWNRPKAEVEGLMHLMMNAIMDETPLFHKNGIRFRVIGDLGKLNGELREKIAECMGITQMYDKLNLIVFLSYSGKWDIVQAANRYMKENPGKEVDSAGLEKYMATAGIPDPDLLIRTSGEERLSNYMLWQTAYTELYFTDVLWPDFRKPQFRRALDVYAGRERRFGRV